MAMRLLVSPGCQELSAEYVERTRRPGEIVLDVGEIFKTLTGSAEIPSTNVPALRLALGLRATAIRHARTDDIDMIIRTGNADRGSIRRLQDQAGPGTPVLVHQIDRDEACRRVRQIVKSTDRQAACEEGLGRFYDRYQPDPDDQIVK